jgi:eukaryotic-like serine/threonine-protein kinase
MALTKGTTLGPYKILKPIGSGGMGEVYRARDTRLERDVAIKVLPENLTKDTALLTRFDREAKLLATLSHTNILTVFDVGKDSGLSYVVTELLEGQSLLSLIEKSPLPWERAVEIAREIAQGLIAAHSKGIVHRDLKPDNIFLTNSDTIKILDFGLARQDANVAAGRFSAVATVLQDTSPGVLLGTIPYMSPEQVRGQVLDHRSDIFSFGCVLYEMIFGCRAFASESAVDVIAAILKDPLPNLAKSKIKIPSQLEAIIRRCLQKDPDERFQTVQELLLSLEQITSEKKIVRKTSKTIDSIAVLPFIDRNLEPEFEYLADGITENIINTLSQVPRLRVMARSTVFSYKGQTIDPIEIGKRLNVRAVLTGAVLHRTTSLNIQTELVDATSGARLWGEDYNSDMEDLHNLEQVIARHITEKLQMKIRPMKKSRPKPTEVGEAYQLYMKGRYYWNKRTLEGFRRSIDCFDEARHLDPNFALAYSGLADAYSFMGGFGYIASRDAYTKAKAEATKALELDATLAEAYTTLATVQYRYDWDWKAAEESFRKALQLNPSYTIAHLWYGVFTVLTGKFQEGLASVKKAVELDPLSIANQWTLGYVRYYARDYENAILASRKALEIDPAFSRAYVDMGLCYIQQGKIQEAIYEIQRGISLASDPSPGFIATLAYAYGVSDQRNEAEKIYQELIEESKRQFVSPYNFALVHIGLGDTDAAFAALNQAFEGREDALVSLKVNPRFDPIRTDCRFQTLLKRIGLA